MEKASLYLSEPYLLAIQWSRYEEVFLDMNKVTRIRPNVFLPLLLVLIVLHTEKVRNDDSREYKHGKSSSLLLLAYNVCHVSNSIHYLLLTVESCQRIQL